VSALPVGLLLLLLLLLRLLQPLNCAARAGHAMLVLQDISHEYSATQRTSSSALAEKLRCRDCQF